MLKQTLAHAVIAFVLGTFCTLAAADRYELRVPGTQIISLAEFDGGDLMIGDATTKIRYVRAPQHDGNGYLGFESRIHGRIIRWPVRSQGTFQIGTIMPYGHVAFRTSRMVITKVNPLPSFRSKESNTPVEVVFHNNHSVAVDYYWVNYQGQEEYAGSLNANELRTQDTFATHPWVFKIRGREIDTYTCNTRRFQHVDLDPAPAPAPQLTAQDLVGTYLHSPFENDYHIGTLEIVAQIGNKVTYRWTNRANVSWILHADLDNRVLHAGPQSPYFNSNPQDGRTFEIVTSVQANGTLKVEGFRFLSTFYKHI